MLCRYHTVSCSCSQVITRVITSSAFLNFTLLTGFLGLRRGEKEKVLGRSCRVDGVKLCNQILLWLLESSNLCVVLLGKLYNFVHRWRELQRCAKTHRHVAVPVSIWTLSVATLGATLSQWCRAASRRPYVLHPECCVEFVRSALPISSSVSWRLSPHLSNARCRLIGILVPASLLWASRCRPGFSRIVLYFPFRSASLLRNHLSGSGR
jgi:hypothetical protein